jgi:hypothetical protein
MDTELVAAAETMPVGNKAKDRANDKKIRVVFTVRDLI